MANLGDFLGTETIYCLFATVQATGAPTTLSGTPKLRCYKNNSTTESSDLTPTVDLDSRTGLNVVAIDLTGDSGFYAAGSDYTIVISAGTVNSVSAVGYVVGQFSVKNRSLQQWNGLATVALPLVPATAGRSLVVDAAGLADANVVKIGPTGAGTAQTAGDIYPKIDTEVATLVTGVADIQTRLPAALVSGRMDSSVGAMAANTMTAAAAAADLTTELQTGLATASALATVQADTDDIQSRLPAALISGRMDVTVGAMQANVVTAAAAAADLTTELQSGLATSAALSTLQTDVTAIGAKTTNLPSDPADASDIASAFGTVNATLSTIAAYIDTEIAAIKAKTDNLPSSPAASTDAATALSTAVTEAYAADNANASAIQLLYEIRGLLSEFSITGTTLTMKKKDGSTTAATYTLDSSTAPTSITRAT